MPGPFDASVVLVYVNMSEPVAATHTPGTTNARYTLTAKDAGTAGNSITIQHDVSSSGGPVVTVNGTAIKVTGGATMTANQVIAAINAHIAAKMLVTATLTTGSDGTGSVATLAATPLTGGAAAPAANYAPIARQQGIDLDDSMDTIDAPSKGDRFAVQLPGRQSGSFELSALMSTEDTTQARLKRAYQNREEILVRIITPASVTGGTMGIEEATCQLTGFSRSYPDSDVATISAPVVLKENWRTIQ
jgi:hypothetical protein